MEILYISYGNSSRSTVYPYKIKSGMSIDSHPESYVLVQTASPYSPGKYVNWNLSFSMEILYISYGNSSRSTVRPYKNCTGQVWYVH